jgi:ribosomal protein S18 acetylase RimI-like enzyme
MSPGLTIRVARPAEYSVIGELTALAYADVLAEGEDDAYRSVLLDAAGRAGDAELLVAVDSDDALVGTVTVGRPGTPLAEIAYHNEVEVRMLAVAPGQERQGIGRSLMRHVHDVAATEGYAGLVLSVISTNTGAGNFYRSLGYLRSPDRDWKPVPDTDLLLEVFVHSVR